MPLPHALRTGSPVVPTTTRGYSGAAGLAFWGRRAPSAAASGGVPFHMEPQVLGNWCWAAVATSTSLHYDPSSQWTKCKLANTLLPISGVDCCVSGSSAACDLDWYLDKALRATSNLAKVKAGAVLFSPLTSLLDGDRPLAIRIRWPDDTGHFIVLHQWQITADGDEFVVVADSLYGSRTIPYDDCVNRYPATGALTGTWSYSYWTQP